VEKESLMPKRFGLIADPERVKEITRLYNVASVLIRDELLKLDAENFDEIKAMAVQSKINVIINKMNRRVAQWTRKSVFETYRDGMTTSRISLNILGAKKDPFFDNNVHKNAIHDDETETLAVYLKANNSIKLNVETYLYLLRQAHNDIMQIEAFDLRDEEVIAGLLDNTIKEGGSRQDLQRLIRIHFKRELYERKFININGRNYQMTKYAEMVARTRLRTVQSDAVKNSCAQYENDLVEISDHGTETEICKPFEGETFSISGQTPGYETISEWPPFHPNCILPGQRCKTPGGIISGMRARYDGQAVKVTFAKAGDLSVTVNHLFLTPNGFAPAHLLRKGDNVFYCPQFEGIIPGDPNENRSPSFIEDIIGTLAKSSSMMTRRMPVTPKDFHSDGRFCNGDVDIIRADGFLHDTGKASFSQQIENNKFNSSGMTQVPFFPKGSFAEILHRAAHASDSIMGGLRSPSPVFLARSGRSDSMGFTDASLGEADFSEDKINGLVGDFKILSKIALQIPGLISVDKVLNVDFFPYHGFVYDLHTKTSLYLVNSVLSSNCEHSAMPTSLEAIEVRGRR